MKMSEIECRLKKRSAFIDIAHKKAEDIYLFYEVSEERVYAWMIGTKRIGYVEVFKDASLKNKFIEALEELGFKECSMVRVKT